MPSSPRRVRRLSGQKERTRPYRRHRPLRKTTCVFSVAGHARIAPPGASPERAKKTDTSIPSASGPMWASAPTKNNVRPPSVGGNALIAPWGATPERSRRTDTSVPSASGPMWASAPTKNNVRFQRRGRCPHRPAGYVSRAVRKTDTSIPLTSGPMWASAPTKKADCRPYGIAVFTAVIFYFSSSQVRSLMM